MLKSSILSLEEWSHVLIFHVGEERYKFHFYIDLDADSAKSMYPDPDPMTLDPKDCPRIFENVCGILNHHGKKGTFGALHSK